MIVPRMEILDPTAKGLEESRSVVVLAGAGAGRVADVDITHYSTPLGIPGYLEMVLYSACTTILPRESYLAAAKPKR